MHPVQQLVAQRMARMGWTVPPSPYIKGCAVVSKTFATAVGPKEAHAYLADFGPHTDDLMLHGQYWSEGHNALGGCLVLLSKDGADAALGSKVDAFARQCERSIGQTYAARLLHSA